MKQDAQPGARTQESQRNGEADPVSPGAVGAPGIPDRSRGEKIDTIAHHFGKIMQALGMDLSDTSLADTPMRVARMYVNETFRGLSAKNFPRISFFEKAPGTPEMIVVNDITLYSYCEHHFVPFFGKVHVAYIPGDRLLGLSKVNRVVDYLSRKPHLQERLTREIADTLSELLQTRHVAVFVEAQHLCVASRGVRDAKSITRTGCYLGQFQNTHTRAEFMASLKMQGSL